MIFPFPHTSHLKKLIRRKKFTTLTQKGKGTQMKRKQMCTLRSTQTICLKGQKSWQVSCLAGVGGGGVGRVLKWASLFA